MPDLEVRDLTLDHRDAVFDLRTRAFGVLPGDALTWWDGRFGKAAADRRAIGAFHGQTLVGCSRIHAYHQFWGGRSLPMGGVAGVVVAPEWRSRGVATSVMEATLARSAELGDVVSALVPSVPTPYRRLGWELAGTISRTSLPAAALRALGPGTVPVRRPDESDVATIVDILRRGNQRARACGQLDLDADDVRELIGEEETFCYLAEDGFVAYGWDASDLRVERLAADSAPTTRALWALVGSGASTARTVYSYLPPDDAVYWIVDALPEAAVQVGHWMLRLLDAPAAIAGRGFPPGLTIDVPLLLQDRWVEAQSGCFRLTVEDGRATLLPARADGSAVELGPNGMAALYAGTPMATLRRAGLAGGPESSDGLLDAAFAGRCTMSDSF